jgi:hypothetical protein
MYVPVPPIYSSHVAGMSGTYHSIQFLLVEMESLKLFARAYLEP